MAITDIRNLLKPAQRRNRCGGWSKAQWTVASFVLTACCICMVGGCTLRPLEIYYTDAVAVHIHVDWDSLFHERPSGMTMLFSKDGDAVTRTIVTNEVDGQTVYLEPGTYRLTVFNQSFDEFGSVYFTNTMSHELLSAKARLRSESPLWDPQTSYMLDPVEPIAVATDTFTITNEMLNRQLTFVDFRQHDVPDDTTHVHFYEVPEPVVTNLHVYVRIKGINSLRAVEGSIEGLADGSLLNQLWRTQTTGTMLLDNWSATADADTVNHLGWIRTRIPTFGLPHGKELLTQRNDDDAQLRLRITLTNDSVMEFTYPVGRVIHYTNDDGQWRPEQLLSLRNLGLDLELEIIIDVPIPFPDLPDVGGRGGGFDAWVDEWEYGGDISVGL